MLLEYIPLHLGVVAIEKGALWSPSSTVANFTRERVAPSPTSSSNSYRKGSLRVTLDYGQLTLLKNHWESFSFYSLFIMRFFWPVFTDGFSLKTEWHQLLSNSFSLFSWGLFRRFQLSLISTALMFHCCFFQLSDQNKYLFILFYFPSMDHWDGKIHKRYKFFTSCSLFFRPRETVSTAPT